MSGLHVAIQGQGPDLVLLHGWALHGGIFDALRAELATEHRVHTIDLPGHGRSTPPSALDKLEDWLATLASLVPPGAAVLGWSLGGLLAMQLAARVPLRALTLVSSTPKFVAAADWPHGMAVEVFAQFAQRLQQDFAGTVEDFLRLQVRGESQAVQTLEELQRQLLQYPPEPSALSIGLDILRDGDVRAALQELRLPTLIVAGEHDRITHPNASRYLAATLPQAHLRIIKRAGHAPFISHRAEFLSELRTFLKQLPA